jgi:hypothetical protein
MNEKQVVLLLMPNSPSGPLLLRVIFLRDINHPTINSNVCKQLHRGNCGGTGCARALDRQTQLIQSNMHKMLSRNMAETQAHLGVHARCVGVAIYTQHPTTAGCVAYSYGANDFEQRFSRFCGVPAPTENRLAQRRC